MEEYQLRKDIDRFKHFLDTLEAELTRQGITSLNIIELLNKTYDKSEVDVVTTKLYNDITSLDTNLDTLKANLVSFNQKLITFNGDTETLATDLSTLGNNLNSVLGDISTITADLSTLSDNFDTLDGNFTTLDSSLTGLSNTVDGLDSDLTTLGNTVSGLSTTIGDANSGLVKELNDVSSSLIGTDGDLRNLIADLETLAEYMTDFEGSLSDFQQELIDNNVELDTISLQSDIVKLFGALSSVKNDVSTVEEDMYGANGTSANPSSGSVLANISDVQDTIGDANSGLVKGLNDTSNAIGNVETDLYGTGTSANPQSGSVKANINQAQTNITNTQNTLYGGSGYSTSNPSSNSVMGQMDTVQEDMYGSNKDPSNPQSGSLVSDLSTAQGNINTIRNNDIPAVQGDISDVQDIMYGAHGSVQNPETGSLLDNVDTVQGDISKVQTDIGSVETDTNGDLQSQILTIVKLFEGLIPVFDTVQVLSVSDYVGAGIGSTGNYYASGMKQVDYVYETSTNKLYERQYLLTSPPLGYYGEWVHISSLPSEHVRFPFTQIYNLISLFFARLSHTHTLSEISDLTDSGWINFPYNTNAQDASTTERPMLIRKRNNTVVITGIGKINQQLSANASVVIGTLGSDYVPSITVTAPWTGNNQQGFIQIDSDGTVTLLNRNGTSGTMSAGTYFVVNCSYII